MLRFANLRYTSVHGVRRRTCPDVIKGQHNTFLQVKHKSCGRGGTWRRRGRLCLRCASSFGTSPSTAVGLFPAGKRQARVTVPALFLTVSAGEVTQSKAALENLGAAVSGGATAVVLQESAFGGANELYEASLQVRELLRGRAVLLIADRTDIAPAAEADGALLSPQGLPTVVAKRNMGDGLLLVGRLVNSAEAAVQAVKEGASYVILQSVNGMPSIEDALAARQRQLSSGNVPILVSLAQAASPSAIRALLEAGIDGVSVPLAALPDLAAALTQEPCGSPAAAAAIVLQAFGSSHMHMGATNSAASREPDEQQQQQEVRAVAAPMQLSQILSASREDAVAQEKALLEEVLEFLRQHCTQLEEASLVDDAIKQLDELFLVVVVGEFNSGKSALINALLGQRYLAEGILPTTNEISVLKWGDPGEGEERTQQDADGLCTRYLPAELLRELNLVDTPGTNVILERQQHLTEEYVPRADLVLFVMSADRPFTESEVRFLKYVRRWRKKIVFVVNKVDILASSEEIGEVVEFVRQNAVRLLGVEAPRVLSVSSRAAMEAKLAAAREEMGDGSWRSSGSTTISSSSSDGALSPEAISRLAADLRWQSSRFEELERFIFDFLVGSASTSSTNTSVLGGDAGDGIVESVRLKLQTPLAIAQALLEAAGVQLQQELDVAVAEERSVRLVRKQLQEFREEMARDARQQRAEVARIVVSTTKKAAAIVEETLKLSNLGVLASYLWGTSTSGNLMPVAKRFEAELAEDAMGGLKDVVKEHSRWLTSNCEHQVSHYRSFAEVRSAAQGRNLEQLVAGEHLPALESDAEARRRWRQMRQLTTEAAVVPVGGTCSATLAAVTALDPKTAEAMLEEEVREAVLSTAGTAAGAGAFGVVLTTILPTTLEDMLALALSAIVGYISILNLPLRRAEAKSKLETLANSFAQDVQSRMEGELSHALDRCEAEVLAFIEPLEQLMAEKVEHAASAEAGRAELAERLHSLQRRVASLE